MSCARNHTWNTIKNYTSTLVTVHLHITLYDYSVEANAKCLGHRPKAFRKI